MSIASVSSYTLAGDSTLRARGTGSVLALPNLTNIDLGPNHSVTLGIEAQDGGTIDLQNVTQISDATEQAARRALVSSSGIGSVLDLSSLQNFLDNSYWDANWHSTLNASNGGTIQAGALTTLHEVDVTLDGTGTLPIDQWERWTNGKADLWQRFPLLEFGSRTRNSLECHQLERRLACSHDAGGRRAVVVWWRNCQCSSAVKR